MILVTMVRSASKYYTGPIRPYEFGFNIMNNQHRHEMKGKDNHLTKTIHKRLGEHIPN